MKRALLTLAGTLAAFAQSSQQSYTYDINGNRVRGAETVSTGGYQTRKTESINGRPVPVEQIEERVIRSDERGRVVERIIRRYTPDGAPVSSERMLIEEEKRPGGGAVVRTSVFQSTASGGLQLIERLTTDVRRSGDATTSEMVVERPSLDGSLAPAEKHITNESKTAAGMTQETAVYRTDTNGRFYEAAKETADRRTSGSRTVESKARYEADASGRMEMAGLTRRTSVKQQDGSESVVVDVYAPSTPGLANADDPGPKIKEQQIIERRAASGGFVETLAVRRPSLSDPNRLGPAQKVSETVCTGKCL